MPTTISQPSWSFIARFPPPKRRSVYTAPYPALPSSHTNSHPLPDPAPSSTSPSSRPPPPPAFLFTSDFDSFSSSFPSDGAFEEFYIRAVPRTSYRGPSSASLPRSSSSSPTFSSRSTSSSSSSGDPPGRIAGRIERRENTRRWMGRFSRGWGATWRGRRRRDQGAELWLDGNANLGGRGCVGEAEGRRVRVHCVRKADSCSSGGEALLMTLSSSTFDSCLQELFALVSLPSFRSPLAYMNLIIFSVLVVQSSDPQIINCGHLFCLTCIQSISTRKVSCPQPDASLLLLALV